MSLRCQDCDGAASTCDCAIEHGGRFAPAAFLDLTITTTETRAADAVAACVRSGASFVEVASDEAFAARQALDHHAMLARLDGDHVRAAEILAMRLVVRSVASRRAA